MTLQIHCPTCSRSLGKLSAEGILKAGCSSCRISYEAIYGKLSHWFSKGEPVIYLGERLPKLFRRRYELRIATPGRQLKLLKLTTLGLEDRLPLRPGDRVSILYSTRGGGMDKLVAIYNHSRGKNYYPKTPIPSEQYLLKTRGSVSVAVFLGALFGGISPVMVSLGAIAMLLYANVIDAAELSDPELRTQNREEARLLNEIKLANQKSHLAERIHELHQEIYDQQGLIKKLQSLRGKMLSFNSGLYATRVGNIETAVRLLRQRIDHSHRLIDEYTQTMRMIEIELEASVLVEQLPNAEDFTAQIFSRLDELKAIEAENFNLQQRVEANEEVRRLSLGP